jgi:selenide,water dikinase
VVHPEEFLQNHTVQEGDVLILTKPLGTGIIATAAKRGIAPEESIREAVQTMETLNDVAADVMADFPVNACTDITGFGLIGHLSEMIRPGNMEVRLSMGSIPLINGAEALATENIIPGGTLNNYEFVGPVVDYASHISRAQQMLLNDAQTSGGLLISAPQSVEKELLKRLHDRGITRASTIGRIVSKRVGKIFVE